MFWQVIFISMLGTIMATEQRRFIFNDQQHPYPNSPYGGSGGMSSPFGGSGGMTGTGSGTGYTACIPSQRTCSLQCVNGYVKGPTGCDFCMCANHAQTVTTMGPVLIDPVDAKVTTAAPQQVSSVTTLGPLPSKTTSSDCMAAKQSCASSCGDKGYLVDPSDCTFCLCKSSMMN